MIVAQNTRTESPYTLRTKHLLCLFTNPSSDIEEAVKARIAAAAEDCNEGPWTRKKVGGSLFLLRLGKQWSLVLFVLQYFPTCCPNLLFYISVMQQVL